jgi:integration host factor subunit alpha
VSISSDNGGKRVALLSSRFPGETLTRADLRDAVYNALATRVSRADVSRLVDEFFEEIGQTLEKGEGVKLREFGVFRILQKRSRVGRNPKTMKEATITARRVITFAPSPVLRAKLNGETSFGEDD